ncbi:hypothetical protein [Streptomyces sp. NPDC059816]|uniref:hypothetical protein n=1 Tax=Streptomyces sp. NPDC059816 TaxID=3346960 RepID=UPI00365421B2
MTGDAYVNGPRGPVNSGTGPQFNGGSFWLLDEDLGRLLRRGPDLQRITLQRRRLLRSRFVPPRSFRDGLERMEAPGAVVLLDGPRGSGRRAAATMLLHQSGGDEGRMEELSPEHEHGAGRLEPGPSDHYLLDLSNTAHDDYPAAQRALAAFRSAVEGAGARMAVVLPDSLDHLLDADLRPLVVRLGRPREIAVFRRHLRVGGIAFTQEETEGEELLGFLATSPMRELAKLAELVRLARDRAGQDSRFPDWCAEAMSAVTDWAGEAARQVSNHRTAQGRALLLTGAMFSGASADAVFHGSDLLLRTLDHRGDDTPRLAQPDLGEQFRSLGIRRDADGRVGFERLAFDSAVRTHFWNNFPDLRDGLRDWVGQALRLPQLTHDDRMSLVERFSDQALAVGRPDHLWVLAEQWTRTARRPLLNAETAAMLERGLVHERYGARFRAQIYAWAVGGAALPADLVRVLTGVCRQVVASTHPAQALVRLHHLALRPGGEEVEEARAALLEMARSSRQLRARLIGRLLSPESPNARAHLMLYLDLVEPVGLRAREPWRQLTELWTTVMDEGSAELWTPVVRRWLSALRPEAEGSLGLQVLLDAASGRGEILNRLYAITCGWAAGPAQPSDGRAATAAAFWHAIDAVQGVDCGGTTSSD